MREVLGAKCEGSVLCRTVNYAPRGHCESGQFRRCLSRGVVRCEILRRLAHLIETFCSATVVGQLLYPRQQIWPQRVGDADPMEGDLARIGR